jgi:hypothetical protein
MTITGGPLTLEQFLALPEAKPALEYGPDGEVTQKMAPTTDHAALHGELGSGSAADRHLHGRAAAEAARDRGPAFATRPPGPRVERG